MSLHDAPLHMALPQLGAHSAYPAQSFALSTSGAPPSFSSHTSSGVVPPWVGTKDALSASQVSHAIAIINSPRGAAHSAHSAGAALSTSTLARSAISTGAAAAHSQAACTSTATAYSQPTYAGAATAYSQAAQPAEAGEQELPRADSMIVYLPGMSWQQQQHQQQHQQSHARLPEGVASIVQPVAHSYTSGWQPEGAVSTVKPLALQQLENPILLHAGDQDQSPHCSPRGGHYPSLRSPRGGKEVDEVATSAAQPVAGLSDKTLAASKKKKKKSKKSSKLVFCC